MIDLSPFSDSGYHVSVDTEYLCHSPDGVILTIGMVAFDFDGRIGHREELRLDYETQIDIGRRVDPNTQAWWREQSEPAKEAAFGGKRLRLEEAKFRVNKLCADAKGVWGFGSYADNAKIRHLFGEDVWHYRADRCGRTLVDIGKPDKMPFSGEVAHRAVDDALNQAQMYIRAMSNIKTGVVQWAMP